MSGNRDFQIKAKQSAIQRRLDKSNAKNKAAAEKKAGKGKTATWNTQYVKGKSQGYTKSDYGVGMGAAIPYSVGTTKKNNKPPTKPKPPTTPPRDLPSNTKPGMNPPVAPTRPIGVNDGLNTWKNKRKPNTNTLLR